MKVLSSKNKLKIEQRIDASALRLLNVENNLIDFSSNDYLGFSNSLEIFNNTHNYLIENKVLKNGATGSRLLSGNHKLYSDVEETLCKFHASEAALIFNSGYDANIGFFSSVPQRGDIILYDELIHASIRDGVMLSHARSYKFKHNDITDLDRLLRKFKSEQVDFKEPVEVYVVTESVFSMDGDTPNLAGIIKLCEKYGAFAIVDEAHAIGVFGQYGCGIVQELSLQDQVFARIITFGKGLGCHGAAILGSVMLKRYLVNFARSFIYTTGLPPHSLATIKMAYNVILNNSEESKIKKLRNNIQFFKSEIIRLNLNFIESSSAIHCCVISGNKKVKIIAQKLQDYGFNVKPILSPTVPIGQERLRFCLHSYNSKKEMTEVLALLSTFVNL